MVEKVKEYLAKDNSIIVFDTNVFLNLYEYSPHVSDFFIPTFTVAKPKNPHKSRYICVYGDFFIFWYVDMHACVVSAK